MARRVLGHVRVVQIGHLLVPFLRLPPRRSGRGTKAAIAAHLDLRLKGVGEVGLVLVGGGRWFTRKTETERVPAGMCPSRSSAEICRSTMWS